MRARRYQDGRQRKLEGFGSLLCPTLSSERFSASTTLGSPSELASFKVSSLQLAPCLGGMTSSSTADLYECGMYISHPVALDGCRLSVKELLCAANCGETADLLRCSRCHSASFCSRACHKVCIVRARSEKSQVHDYTHILCIQDNCFVCRHTGLFIESPVTETNLQIVLKMLSQNLPPGCGVTANWLF